MRYERILKAFYGAVWAILPEKYEAIKEFLELKAAGIDFGEEEIKSRIGVATRANNNSPSSAISILPLQGIISQKISLANEISGPGGTSTESFAKAFKTALTDSAVGAIVIDVDSPGGVVFGVPELSDLIYKSRGQKPILASVNSIAASAAYWIASAADEIAITPSGEAGSIGVFAEHVDISEMMKQKGAKSTLISAGKYKTEGNPYEPLTEEGRAHIQERVDDYYSMFVSAVARNRGITTARVKREFGEGRMMGAAQAAEAGMVDKIASFDQAIKRLSGSIKTELPDQLQDSVMAIGEVLSEESSGMKAGPIAPHSTGTSEAPWDGPANEARLPSPMSVTTARNSYAWMEDEAVEDGQVRKTDCRFLHHDINANGRPGAANMRACSAGIAVLNGGRGGTTIPQEDRPGVHRHLARHLRDGGREAPPLAENENINPKAEIERERRILELLNL